MTFITMIIASLILSLLSLSLSHSHSLFLSLSLSPSLILSPSHSLSISLNLPFYLSLLPPFPFSGKFTLLGEFKGEDLVGTKYQHPFYERQSEIVIGGDYITTESGTYLNKKNVQNKKEAIVCFNSLALILFLIMCNCMSFLSAYLLTFS